MSDPSITRQTDAIEHLIAIVTGAKSKPKPAVMDMLIADARAGVQTIRRSLSVKTSFADRTSDVLGG